MINTTGVNATQGTGFYGATGDGYEQHRQAGAKTPMQRACQNHWLREISTNRKQGQSLTAARSIEADAIRKCVLKRQPVARARTRALAQSIRRMTCSEGSRDLPAALSSARYSSHSCSWRCANCSRYSQVNNPLS